jgi:hypothetical protein
MWFENTHISVDDIASCQMQVLGRHAVSVYLTIEDGNLGGHEMITPDECYPQILRR